MSQVAITIFTTYQLTIEEEHNGAVLNEYQRQVFQNDRADIAKSLVNLEFDETNPARFNKERAFLQGRLELYNFLLERSEDTAKFLAGLDEEQSEE